MGRRVTACTTSCQAVAHETKWELTFIKWELTYIDIYQVGTDVYHVGTYIYQPGMNIYQVGTDQISTLAHLTGQVIPSQKTRHLSWSLLVFASPFSGRFYLQSTTVPLYSSLNSCRSLRSMSSKLTCGASLVGPSMSTMASRSKSSLKLRTAIQTWNSGSCGSSQDSCLDSIHCNYFCRFGAHLASPILLCQHRLGEITGVRYWMGKAVNKYNDKLVYGHGP